MRKASLLLFMAVLFLSSGVKAQQEEPFKPSGKVEVRIFSNFTSSFSDGKNLNKFDVTRAYLGYIYDFSRSFRGRVTYDVGNPGAGSNHYSGFLKFAYLQYHKGNFSLMGGMIPQYQYSLTDEKWGYRYILNPFHNEYGFGTPADMGLGAEYKVAPWLTADMILVNGEGFKKSEADSTFKAGVGLSIYPVKNLQIRGYFDTMKRDKANQQTTEFLATYEDKSFKLSGSYNFQKDHALVKGNDYSGYSINGTLFLKNSLSLIARYDLLESVTKTGASLPWNIGKDGQFFLAGLQFVPVKGVSLSPNYQLWNPEKEGLPSISRLSIHMDIKI